MSGPDLAQLRASAHVVSIPLTTPFRGVHHREAMIFSGPAGPAEWSPFVEYDDDEAALWLKSACEQGWNPVAHHLSLPTTIRVNGTIPAVAASEVEGLIVAAGYPRTVKVKVGGPGTTLMEDVARVAEARRVLGPTGRVRIDANGCWSVDEAEHAIREMEHLDLEYVEQPVASLEDMVEIRQRISRMGIPVAADESIRRWSDYEQTLAAGACDLIVLKVQPLGGVRATEKLLEKADNAGVGVVLSSALDTSVGLHQAALLQARRESSHPDALDAGLGTSGFLAHDVVKNPLVAHGGELTLEPLELDPQALTERAAPPDRERWWLERLERCWKLL